MFLTVLISIETFLYHFLALKNQLPLLSEIHASQKVRHFIPCFFVIFIVYRWCHRFHSERHIIPNTEDAKYEKAFNNTIILFTELRSKIISNAIELFCRVSKIFIEYTNVSTTLLYSCGLFYYFCSVYNKEKHKLL